MADIFLSYSHHDRAKAAHIVQALAGAGYSVFWDQTTPTGDDWNFWIRDELHKARLCVALWSKNSVNSRNVVHEATIALEDNKLVPAMIETLRTDQFPMGFYTVQAVDVRSRSPAAMKRLVGAVRKKLGAGSGAASDAPETVSEPFPKEQHIIQAKKTAGATPLRFTASALSGCLAGYLLIAAAGHAPSAMKALDQVLDRHVQCVNCEPKLAATPSQRTSKTLLR